MSQSDFKKMLFTAFGRKTDEFKQKIYDMVIPIIEVEDGDETTKDVSIAKLSQFIDFYNYAPLMMCKIKHKNDSSEDLQYYMGKTNVE